MQSEDEVRKDIKDIKSEVSTLKTEFYNLIDILQASIPEVKQLRDKSLTETFEDTETNKSIVSVLNYSLIKDTKMQKLACEYDKNIYKYKEQKKFYEFCYYLAGLVEEISKVFLERKFRELQEGKNEDLLEAYSLVNDNFNSSGNLRRTDIYIGKNEVLKARQQHQDENDSYHPDGDRYLSLIKLKMGDSWFLLDMCFVILWKKSFYQEQNKFSYKNYEKNTGKNKQKVPAAIQRQSIKVNTSNALLNMDYYFRLNNIRKIRNKYEHNKNNSSQLKQEIEALKEYVKVDLDNYDGIIEAAKWLLIQLDVP